MYYIVYKITNRVNGKFYIGTHKTVDPNDDYMGSGTLLKRAQAKYGMDTFLKEILFVFDNPKDMFDKEAELVTEDLLAEENTYNLKVGGFGGFDYINSNPEKCLTEKRLNALWTNKQRNLRWKEKHSSDASFRETVRKNALQGNKKSLDSHPNGTFFGKSHSAETRMKIGSKTSLHQSGSGNSQYGKMWIYNDEMQQSVRIGKDEPVPSGWKKGRKIKF